MALDNAVTLAPEDTVTRRLMIRVQVDKAETVLPIDPKYAQYMKDAVANYRTIEDQKVAASAKVLQASGTPENRYAYGRALIEAGKYADALPEFRKASQVAPEKTAYTNALALAMFLNGQGRQATNSLEAVVNRGKDNAYTHFVLALILEDQAEYKKALDEVHQAGLKGGDELYTPLLEAVLQMRLAKALPSKEANDSIAAAAKAAPDSALAQHFRAIAIADQGNYYDALVANSEALKLNPTLVEAYAERATMYFRNSWAEELDPKTNARALLDLGLTFAPTDPYLLCGLCITTAEDNDHRKALEIIKRAADVVPDKIYVQIILAYGYAKNRYPDEARAALERVRVLSHNEMVYASAPQLGTLYILWQKYGRTPPLYVPEE